MDKRLTLTEKQALITLMPAHPMYRDIQGPAQCCSECGLAYQPSDARAVERNQDKDYANGRCDVCVPGHHWYWTNRHGCAPDTYEGQYVNKKGW